MKRRAWHLIESVVTLPTKWLCELEFRLQRFTRFNERPVEFGFVFQKISELYPRTVLDVGTGTTALPHLMRNCGCLVTATDNIRDYWPVGMHNRHYHVINDDITATSLTDSFDMITCISVLEHVKDSAAAVRNMIGLLRPGGHLVMTFPYTENSYIDNVYALPGSSYGQSATYVTQSYSRNELRQWLEGMDAAIVDQEYWQYWDGAHWTIGNQVIPPRRVDANSLHQLTCVLVRKN